ncbi:MAG: helix-turn-helix transcriptional regulator [Ruminiclostridium sp.]|nr:helix-turn-helix transcriptional regulator [Ruminiclostridium sp.]
MNADFPRILALLRKERHISQKAAAADLGVAQALLSHYEKGKREPGLDFLVRVANYYNVSTDYLLGRSAVSTGGIITENDIPNTEAPNKAQAGANISVTLSKKLLMNSVDIIYDILGKISDSKLTGTVTAIMNFTVYKVFRLVFRANKSNSQTMFEISDEKSCHVADAGIHLMEADLSELVKGLNSGDAEISTVLIEKEYPKKSAALLSLVKSSEAQLQKISEFK